MIKLIRILDAHQVLMQMAEVKLPYGVARKLAAITKLTGEEMSAFEAKRDELANTWREKDISDEEKNSGYAQEMNEILVSEIDTDFPKLKEEMLDHFEVSVRDLAMIDFLIED